MQRDDFTWLSHALMLERATHAGVSRRSLRVMTPNRDFTCHFRITVRLIQAPAFPVISPDSDESFGYS